MMNEVKNKNYNNGRLRILGIALSIISINLFSIGYAEAAASLLDAFTYGKASGQLRYRFEHVEQEPFKKDANASTLRTQLGYTTDAYLGFTAFLQLENITQLGNDNYNSTDNLKTQYPTVADPEGTEVNQAWISYETPYSTTLKYGRQGINLDNQRFIGTVNFRQNEQTFDAFSVINTSLADTTLFYANVNNVNRVFGQENPNPALADTRTDSHLINLTYKGLRYGALTGYAYLLDFTDKRLNPQLNSQKSIGARFDGSYKLKGNNRLLYTGEYANQSPYEDGRDTNEADYGFGGIGLDHAGLVVKLNYEILGGDGTYGFATPFATLHAFNGWADRFLTTPRDGLQDIFFTVGKTLYGINLLAAYHDFSSDNESYSIGNEIDLSAAKKINKQFTVKVEYANYSADRNSDNVTRNVGARAIQTRDASLVWLTADFQF